MPVTVRPAEGEEERLAAADMALALLEEAATRTAPSPRRELRPDARDRWLEAVRLGIEDGSSQLFVALDDGELIGFCLVCLKEQAPEYAMRHVARIMSVAVREDHHGQGVATRMMKDAARWARDNGMEVLALTTPYHNVAARYAWGSMGFEERAIVMEREITDDALDALDETQTQRVIHTPMD